MLVRRMLVVVLLAAAAAPAQLTRGFISGTVQDSSSAVVDAVRVIITNKATNLKNETVTNSLGVYRFVAVEPGTYVVEFSKSGFETKRVENITVGTTQEVVINPVLEVAGVATTVEVVEATPGVELATLATQVTGIARAYPRRTLTAGSRTATAATRSAAAARRDGCGARGPSRGCPGCSRSCLPA